MMHNRDGKIRFPLGVQPFRRIFQKPHYPAMIPIARSGENGVGFLCQRRNGVFAFVSGDFGNGMRRSAAGVVREIVNRITGDELGGKDCTARSEAS